jgi:RNA polymerase sigma-70 factor (ECF subfamily)
MVAVEDNELLQGDEALASRIRAGDRAAENELVRIYSGRVFAMMIVRLRDRETARELTDDVLMAAVSALRRGSVNGTGKLGAFLHGIAVNLANNHIRSSGRRPRTESLDAKPVPPDQAVDAGDDDDVLAARRAIGRLPPQDQRILLLTLVDGLKPGEIASRLGLSSDVVRQRKSRALHSLREMLGPASRMSSRGPQEDD